MNKQIVAHYYYYWGKNGIMWTSLNYSLCFETGLEKWGSRVGNSNFFFQDIYMHLPLPLLANLFHSVLKQNRYQTSLTFYEKIRRHLNCGIW